MGEERVAGEHMGLWRAAPYLRQMPETQVNHAGDRLGNPSMASAAATAAHLRLLSSPFLSKPLLSKPHFLALSRPVSFQRLAARSAASPTPSTSSSATSPTVDPAQLPPALRDIIALFQSVPDERTRYKQLLAYAARLPAMDPALKTDANRVRGCVSQVWVHAAPEADAPGRVRFQADSDTQLTKGLSALLVLGLSGAPARDVAMVPVEFIEMLGIRQSLSPSLTAGIPQGYPYGGSLGVALRATLSTGAARYYVYWM